MNTRNPEIRILTPGDEALLERFLLPRKESSLFLLSNLRRAGLSDRGQRLQGTYVAAVEEGEVVARLSSVFGDVVRSYLAPQSGVVIGKSVDPIAETGARILHLGLVTSDDHPYVPRDLDTILRLPE